MLKKMVSLIAAVAAVPLFALRPGDQVEELTKVKWIKGGALRMLPPAKPVPSEARFKVVTFLLTRAPNAPETMNMLHALARAHKGNATLAVVTPDPELDAETLLKTVPGNTVALGLDGERKLTLKYMGASLLFPMTFIADPEGKIIWSGETMDAGEALEQAVAGTLNPKVQQEIAPMLDEMQTLLRENNDRRMGNVAAAVFRRDPGNAAALRLRLFALENSGRIPEAWNLLQERLKAAPEVARIYFTAIDFILRYPGFGDRLGHILSQFSRRIPERDRRLFMAWTLLRNFRMNIDALNWAATLAKPLPDAVPDSTRSRAMALMVKGQLAYQCGEINDALPALKEAAGLWKKENAPAEAEEARQMAVFMEKARKIILP